MFKQKHSTVSSTSPLLSDCREGVALDLANGSATVEFCFVIQVDLQSQLGLC